MPYEVLTLQSVRMKMISREITIIVRFHSPFESQGRILSLKMGVEGSSRKVSIL
jgi:hypothetical protein